MHKRLISVDVLRRDIHKGKTLLEKILFIFTNSPASYVIPHVCDINVDVTVRVNISSTARVNVGNAAVDIVAI